MALALAVKCAPEPVEGTEELVDRRPELAVRLVAAVGGQVRPEHRVVDVPAEVEREALLQPVDRAERVLVAGLGQLVKGGVGAGDVRRVVLAVVQLHDLTRDVRLERRVVVGQVRKCVLTHVVSFDCPGPVIGVNPELEW